MERKFNIRFAIVLLSLMQTACVFDKESEMPGYDSGEALTINLNLTVPSSAVGTRSRDHDDASGTDAENYIDVENGDYQIHVFDKDGSWLKQLTADKKSIDISSDHTRYSISAKLEIANEGEKARLSKFLVMVLANWKGFEKANTRSEYSYPPLKGYSVKGDVKSIYKEGDAFNFMFKNATNDDTDITDAWVPSSSGTIPSYIPMFGVSEEISLEFAMEMSKWGDSPITSIPMLRSVAKIEVIDELGDKISTVSIKGASQSGRFIPDIIQNTSWSENEIQVTEPSLPSSTGSITRLQFFDFSTEDKSKWIAYIPEMDLSVGTRPEFIIDNGTNEILTPFNNYDNNTGKVVTDSKDYLYKVLRNHIYRYSVTINDEYSVSLALEVLPWDMEWDSDGPWYFNNPEVSAKLSWVTTTDEITNPDKVASGEENPQYASNGYVDNPDILRLTMKEGTTDYAKGTFTLSAPKNCRWHAELIPLEGRPDAFYFVNENGEEITGYPTGPIGPPATIRIMNRYEQVNTNPNEMRLVIFVEYPDNSVREVKVVEPVIIPDETTEDNSSGSGSSTDGFQKTKTIDNYTIYQERTDIY